MLFRADVLKVFYMMVSYDQRQRYRTAVNAEGAAAEKMLDYGNKLREPLRYKTRLKHKLFFLVGLDY